jgi:hypothetical protein
MKCLPYLLVLSIQTYSLSQTLAPDLWYNGKVVLENKDTLHGLIKYDMLDLLQVTRNSRSEIFPAEKIVYFEIFDPAAKRSRQFYSMPFIKKGHFKKPVFFELISNGKITLLARERIETITYSQSTNSVPPKIHRVLRSHYYLLEDKDIKKISDKPDKLLKLMEDQSDQVRLFVKTNKLSLDHKYDLKQVIDYYNSLF